MLKVQTRSNLIPFLLIMALGIAASIYVPTYFPNTEGEIPAFALFPGEIAVSLIMSVLIFENATPAELIKIAAVMLAVSFLDGAICNLVGQRTMLMPDATLKLNWVQLIAFNVTGMAGIMSLYTTVAEGYASRPAAPKEAAPPKMDFSPQEAATKAEESQEIIGQLDEERIERLEESITPAAPEKVSLESLFAEETESASSFKREAEPVRKFAPEPEPEPIKETIPEPEQPVQAAFSFETIPAELAPAVEPAKSESLLSVSDGEVSDLFDNLLAGDSAAPMSPAAAEPAAVQEAAPEPVVQPAEPASAESKGGLLGDVSGDIENLFGELAGEASQKDFSPSTLEKIEESAPAAEAAPEAPAAPEPVAPPAPEEVSAEGQTSFGPKMDDAGTSAKAAVKEFGKLSANASNKPEQAAGTLKTIGQMLLDTGAVERIIKRAETQEGGSQWKVLTVDRGANLQALMDRLARFEGVESALLMGKDGLLLSNTESLSAMKYVFGPLSLAMHSTTNLGTSKLHMGELQQAVLRSGDKINVLTDVGSAILAVFGDWNTATLDRLMAHINAAVTGSDAGSELPTEAEAPDLSAPEPAELPPPPPAEPAAAQGGPLNVSDGEVADIFDNLMAEGSSDKKVESAPKQEAAAAPAAAQSGGLLNVSDKEVGDLFDNLMGEPEKKSMDFTPAEQAAPQAPVAEAPAAETKAEPVAEKKPEPTADKKESKKDKKKDGKPAQQIKEFGKLSVQAAKTDTGAGEGAMKAIGKQLIDVQAVENIIKSGEKREKIGAGLTTARVISAARGEGIKTLLSKIDTYEGVIGSLIVGHDGLVIASTLSGGIDKDMMGAMCTAIYSHMDVAIKKLERGKLQQSVFLGAGEKITVMTSVAVGILAVFVDHSGLDRVDGLLHAIETTVKG